MKLSALLLVIFSIPAYCEVTQESYCLYPLKGQSSKIELRTYFDSDTKWQGAFIKYEKSKKPIPLVIVGSIEDGAQSSSPPDRTTKWVEVVHGKISGEYEMKSQGGNIGSMTYKNYKSQKTVNFIFDMGAQRTHTLGCDW
jgi:hypothetical protein